MMYPWYARRPLNVDDELSYFLSIRANERITYGYNPCPAGQKSHALRSKQKFSFLSSRNCDPRARPQRTIRQKLGWGGR